MWSHPPLLLEGESSQRQALFMSMLGIGSDCDTASQRKLLICVDEISKLLDNECNKWAGDKEANKRFWREIYSLTRATDPHWIRIVMTGFTDSPGDAIAASGIGCKSYSLSMITDAEQQLLSAELLWAHAIHNVRFPGLLWTLVKSTPGLLGLWAQQINLQTPFIKSTPREAMNLSVDLPGAAASVP